MTANRDASGARLRRGGYTLVEVVLSVVVLLSAMTVVVKLLGWVGLERREADRRSWAVQEVANVMERLTARPFDEITAEQAGRLTLSPSARQSLPEAELAVGVAEDQPGAGRSAKRIAVRLRWRGRAGEWEAPVRLTTWIERGRPAR